MRTRTMVAAAVLLGTAPFHQARAAVTVEIATTDPEGGGKLHAGEALYVRIAYQSDGPVRFQLNGYLDGTQRLPLLLIIVSPFVFVYLIALVAAKKYVASHSIDG